MDYLFLLSKENIDLAKEEVLALLGKDKYNLIDNLLIISSKNLNIEFLQKRLAYTRSIYSMLFTTDTDQLTNSIQNYNWNKIYKENFLLRSEIGNEKEYGSMIWRRLKEPKVALKNPKTLIQIFHRDKVYCCLLLAEIKNNFNERKSHKRPENQPISLNPKLARALINLTGIKKGDLVDPFCGTGGILIEAGLMGLKPIGYDIDEKMLRISKINLTHYEISNFTLEKKDALTLSKKINYLVTDLPYGKNTKQKEIELLYKNFMKTLSKILVKKSVIIFPLFKGREHDYVSLIPKEFNYKSFDVYVHKSLSKKIFLLEKI